MNSKLEMFFASPGFWFNFLSFASGVAGCVFGIAGIWIAVVQLGKTLNAATAAKKAAEEVRADFNRVIAVIDLQRLSGICREIINDINADRSSDVSRALHQLRTGLAQFHASGEGISFDALVNLPKLISTIEVVQKKYDAADASAPDDRNVKQCLALVKTIDEKLHTLIPVAANI